MRASTRGFLGCFISHVCSYFLSCLCYNKVNRLRSLHVVVFLWGKIMNEKPEVSAKEFGALWANVEHIKEGVDKHTITLERIENIARTNVTQAQLEKHKKESDERYVKRTEIEGVMNFWSLITSNLAKLFAIALVGLAIYATNNLIQQNKAVTELKEEVQQTQVRRK